MVGGSWRCEQTNFLYAEGVKHRSPGSEVRASGEGLRHPGLTCQLISRPNMLVAMPSSYTEDETELVCFAIAASATLPM